MAESVDKYEANLALYNALNSADSLGMQDFFVEKYESIYTNQDQYTSKQISAFAKELNYAANMSNDYQAPYWNENPILWTTSDGTFGD